MVRSFVALSVLALTGCAEMGQVLAEHQEYQRQNPQRSYIDQPFQPLQSPVQPQTNKTEATSWNDGYQMVAVNTPSGIVYKRCKMLNGKTAHCI